MKRWMDVVRVAVAVGLMCPSPVAWAQLADIDPALNAAVEALVMADPEVAGDAELAQLCRSVAESTVTDIRERIAVAQEVGAMQREGVDVRSIIPDAVRETAREQFTKVQREMQREAERLRSVDPERAKGIELMMREGERQMTAFQGGERYVPSTEMVAHAREMFGNWEADMVSRGAPPEFMERARMEMARFSSGEGMMFGGGPGREYGGPMGGPGMQGTPSIEQMQAMGMTADQIQAAQAGGHTLDGRSYGGGSNYGINPATGGWEPGMGGATGQMPSIEQMQAMGMSAEQIQHARSMEEMMAGNAVYGVTDWSAGGGTYAGGTTDWSAGGGTYGSWEGGSNYGINPATGGWEPNMGGGTVYGGGETWTQTTEGNWVSNSGTQTELRQDYQSNTQNLAQERYETATHLHEGNVEHQHTIHVHSDSTRHDHVATSPADVAPGAVFQ